MFDPEEEGVIGGEGGRLGNRHYSDNDGCSRGCFGSFLVEGDEGLVEGVGYEELSNWRNAGEVGAVTGRHLERGSHAQLLQ